VPVQECLVRCEAAGELGVCLRVVDHDVAFGPGKRGGQGLRHDSRKLLPRAHAVIDLAFADELLGGDGRAVEVGEPRIGPLEATEGLAQPLNVPVQLGRRELRGVSGEVETLARVGQFDVGVHGERMRVRGGFPAAKELGHVGLECVHQLR